LITAANEIASVPVSAQLLTNNWPSKTIVIIVPFPAGGKTAI
jgi:tripartite-type tricarboxylate transporter receptor subunit TctC